jgi:hypothetical protein
MLFTVPLAMLSLSARAAPANRIMATGATTH